MCGECKCGRFQYAVSSLSAAELPCQCGHPRDDHTRNDGRCCVMCGCEQFNSIPSLLDPLRMLKDTRAFHVPEECKHGFTEPHNLPGGLQICVPGLRAAFDREEWEKNRTLTTSEAEKALQTALDKPLPTFPFGHRDRYEVAYTLLVWELLKLTEGSAPEGNISNLQVIAALTKAAGELT